MRNNYDYYMEKSYSLISAICLYEEHKANILW